MRDATHSRGILGLLILLVIAGFSPQFTRAQAEGQVPYAESRPCRGDIPRSVAVSCGVVIVALDRDDPDSGTLELAYAIIHSTASDPAPDPIISLTGGPGGITVPYLSFSLRSNYYDLLAEHDLIFFDQRGTGFSEPALDCDNLLSHSYSNAGVDLSDDERNQIWVDALQICREQFDGNLDLINTPTFAADLADIRLALGYDEWNLFGVSYGTVLALTTMRDFPEGIRSVIIDSVSPLDANLWEEIAVNQARAFDLLFASCAADEDCAAAYPTLEADFYVLVETLNAAPVLVRGRHSQAGFTFSAYIDGDMLASEVFSRLYVKDAIPELPRMIARLVAGNYDELPIIAQNVLDRPFGISEGMYYSVHCAEEVPFADLDIATANAGQLNPVLREARLAGFDSMQALCAQWGVATVDASENDAVISDIPTLVLSGEFDPITPPRWGQQAASTLSNSYFYTFPAVGHGAIRSDDCALNIALQFLDNPSQEPDASCIDTLPAPDFVVD